MREAILLGYPLSRQSAPAPPRAARRYVSSARRRAAGVSDLSVRRVCWRRGSINFPYIIETISIITAALPTSALGHP